MLPATFMGFKDFDDENNNNSEDCNYYKLSFQQFYSKLEERQTCKNKICIYIANHCPKKFSSKHIIHTLLLTRFLINTQKKKRQRVGEGAEEHSSPHLDFL